MVKFGVKKVKRLIIKDGLSTTHRSLWSEHKGSVIYLTQEKKRIISPQRNLGREPYNHQCRRWSPENALRVREPVKLIAYSYRSACSPGL
jgi:hypothetical protein